MPVDSVLVREGTPGASCFVILSGSLVAFASKTASPVSLRVADTFGEAGLLADVLREHTVSAIGVCRAFVLDRSTIDPPREAWRRPEVTAALQATPEWAELRHTVTSGMLEQLPFFGQLVASRRNALAAMMTIINLEQGHVIFREGDMASKFYIVSEGAVEIHKAGGRFSGSRVVSMITSTNDRPWFGEVALWLRKPRAGSAIAVSESCRLLSVDEIHFDTFLAHVPDFRPYLNKNHKQASVLANKKGIVSLEAAAAEDSSLGEKQNVLAQWHSGGRLGGRGGDSTDLKERSVYAERWERMVTMLLYMPLDGMALPSASARSERNPLSTVSFRTADYVHRPDTRTSVRRSSDDT